ncbi:phosphoglucosamine mutase [Cryomorphaceae bacterium 1068]|nr:phosphoglucosamine mutase [Cryomorphaceae bacterium 1068]
MTLIKSISGIRGTIGGKAGENLTPIDIVKFTAAYGQILKNSAVGDSVKVVIGRDARKSGPMVRNFVSTTLTGMGIEVIDLGLSTTPTVEIAVPEEKANGGIIITASHNPGQWNALKLLNSSGEFISADAGQQVIELAETLDIDFAEVDGMGSYRVDESYLLRHIELVLNHPLVDKEAIAAADFHVAVDAVNSSGGIFIPALLEELGVKRVEQLFCTPNGEFPHNPEPLPEHLVELSNIVREKECDLGITVDPDVDRLAFVSENGDVFGEEYTLVAVADYVLSQKKGNTVSNLSSTRALRDVTERHGGTYHASSVGEVNVVEKMRQVGAVIGGEGNGGIIDPELHYGRDALIGVGLFLTHLAKSGMSMTELRASYPSYYMSKNKIQLTPAIDVDDILKRMAENHKDENINTIDGVKIDFAEEWVHLRKSNTEPIIRVYTESKSPEAAQQLAERIIDEIKSMIS